MNTAPAAVRTQLRRGLALVEQGYAGNGLRGETVQWARRLADGDPITREKAIKMRAWFARHGVAKLESARRLRDPKSPAAVAYLLWGGDPSIAYKRSGWRDPVASWLRGVLAGFDRHSALRNSSDWRSAFDTDSVDEIDYMQRQVPALRGEIDSIVQRVLGAGAVAPLHYIGTGMTAMVVCDARKRGYKVARKPRDFAGLANEAEWLRIANTEPAIREHVARFYRWHASEGVIERECVRAKPSEKLRSYGRSDKIWKLHQLFRATMKRYGWSVPELKDDSYIDTRDRGLVLVDAGQVLRVGTNLAREVIAKHRNGAEPWQREFARGEIRAEMDRTIPRAVGERLNVRLAAMKNGRNRH